MFSHNFNNSSPSLNTESVRSPLQALEGNSPLNPDSVLKFGNHSSSKVLDQVWQEITTRLSQFASDPNYVDKMSSAFGMDWSMTEAQNLFKEWAANNFKDFLQVEVSPDLDTIGANGAYAGETNTIYLSSNFLAQNTDHPDAVASVLLEEIGHAIDFRINQYDAPGDEGDIFSRLLRGEQISGEDLLALKTENDHALITLGGSSVAIEMSQIQMAEVGGKLYQTHRGRDNGIYIASSNNGRDWGGWERLPGATENAPAIVNLRGTAYIAHRGLDNRIYFASYDDAKAGRWKALPNGGVTPDAPAMVEHRGKIYMAHRGQDNGIYLASSDGVNWSGWSKLAGETPDAIAMAVYQGKLYLAHRGMNNQIFTASIEGDNDRFSGWKQQAGATPDSLSLTDFNGKLYAMHRGMNNHMYISSLSNGQNWDNWEELPGTTPSAPFIRAFQDKLYATHQGMGDQIFLGAINSDGSFNGWQARGGLTPLDGLETPLNSRYQVSSEFGKRFRNGKWENHTGIDLATNGAKPSVEATRTGKVIFAGWNKSGYGNLVKIDHGNGLQTWYAHLSEIAVKVGDLVTEATRIGNVGSTGDSTGPHLHFEVRVNGVAKNPRDFMAFS